MLRAFFAFAVLWCAASVSFGADGSDSASLRLWPVDVHSKIFADSAPGESGAVAARAARNEYESAQFGVFSESGLENATLSVSDLVGVDDASQKIDAANVRLRPIDRLPIARNTPGAEAIVVREAPCEIPDILRDETTFSLQPGESKGVWTTIFVPSDVAPGKYAATISVRSDVARAEIPLELEVFRFELPSERHLWATNWFSFERFADVHHVKIWSEEYWTVLEKYFENMAAHRQNVVLARWVPDDRFVKATRAADGTISVDFSNLERYLQLAEKTGVGERIEFSHLGGINRENHSIAYSDAVVFDKKSGENVRLSLRDHLEPFASALENFLVATNRIDRATIHVSDEPYQPDMPAWREASERLHKIAPKIKRIDAIESLHFGDALEVWVPKLSHLDRWREEFDRATARPDVEVWYYICCHPVGDRYPNRFIDLPGSRIRSLHWLNYAEDITGYLHWGYNYWFDDPFGPPTERFAPGDTHVVYPGPLDSIRWELERESLEDYEYFVLLQNLTQKALDEFGAELWPFDPKARSKELARRVVRSLSDVELDAAVFETTRLELAREIESLIDGPRLILRTFPGDNGTLVPGPTIVEAYGLTTPGATVSVDGRPIDVRADGTFEFSDMNSEPHSTEIVATLDGKTTKTVRTFVGPK